MPYDVGVTAPIERPKTPAAVVLVGTGLAVLIGLIVLKMVIGFVITLAKVAIAVAVITAVIIAVSRAMSD